MGKKKVNPYITQLMSAEVKFVIEHLDFRADYVARRNYGFTLHGDSFTPLSWSFQHFGQEDMLYLTTHFKKWTREELAVQIALGIIHNDLERTEVWERK